MSNRENWGSKIGFILAAAGSAVGLGNIWRFPYMTGKMGGAVFLVVYLGAVIVVGLPIMIAEIALGRATNKNPVGAYTAIKPKGGWKLVGFLGVLTGVMIFSFYSVVAGWSVGYFFKAITGELNNIDSAKAGEIFSTFVANGPWQVILTGFFILITALIVVMGVTKGIERMSKIMMPALFVILILLVIRSVTLPNAGIGLEFYLKPDFSKINPEVVIAAMGQAFFSLSLGMGAMMTYGSYLSKKDNIPSAGGWVALLDTSVAVLAGFMIFPALFSVGGIQPTEGPGLVFQVLPIIFSKIPLGIIVGPLFFLLLILAALTSTISLLEVPVAYLIDERKWSRKKANLVVGLLTFLFGIPCALSGKFLGLWDLIWGNLSLSIGAFFIALFVGHVWKTANALQEISQGTKEFKLARVWAFWVKYISPLIILLILLSKILSSN
ncbi:MAG: neurotransmitter:Na+ symporter, family [Acidobacteriota bacterium]|nr:neurotransmitter:Na+ symporter, family [Acidobacteriota bacterium]